MRLSKDTITLTRATKGLTIRALAESSGCSTVTIQRAIRGEDIRAISAGKIANALGVDLALLVADPENQQNS